MEKLRRFAPFGLYLALLAALASFGQYVVLHKWDLPLQISLGLIVLGLALFIALDPERTRRALVGRQARYGSNVLLMGLAFVGILVVINYLVYKNPWRYDLTEDKQNTLTQQTLDTLKTLPQPVFAQAFYPSNSSSASTDKKMLDNYKYYSKGNFDYKFIDPNADPVAAKNANVTFNGSPVIALKMGDRQETVTSATEQDITGALIRLMAKKQSIYFLIGNGEFNPDDTGDDSLSQLKTALESKSYVVQTLNLLAVNKIPDDARVIVIGGPKKALSDQEVKLLTDFQAKGGALIVMSDSPLQTDTTSTSDPLASYLAKSWGITLGDDVVLDSTMQNQPYVAISDRYSSSSPVTNKLRLVSAFPFSRSVTAKSGNVSGVTSDEIIYTAPQSAAVADLASLRQQKQPTATPGKDIEGNVPIAVTAERSADKARVVVFGSSSFAVNANYSFYGNGDIITNAVDWAAQQENIINLNANEPKQRLLVAPSTYTEGILLLGSIFVIPGLVLVLGVVVWLVRRSRG